jgi:putative oxidoreductase
MPMLPQDPSRRLSWGNLLTRILVGWVFLSEGVQKFLFPAALGTGRFAKIGIPGLSFSLPLSGLKRSFAAFSFFSVCSPRWPPSFC